MQPVTQLMAPSVIGTVITKGKRVEFVVLFQGAPAVGDALQTFADLLRRSPAVVAFLRCDSGSSNETVNAVARRFVCDLL